MGALERLIDCAGHWAGSSRLLDPMMNIEESSTSLLVVSPILGGKFVRLDYSWSYRGSPQQGSLLVGWREAANEVSVYWIDSWHMGTQVMVSTGIGTDPARISVLGSYAAPPGPDWGWRTELRCDADTVHLLMYNISPDSREMVAVDCDYRRAHDVVPEPDVTEPLAR